MNYDLIKALLIIGISSSIISTTLVQKIKSMSIFKCSNCLLYISFFISMTIGIVFTLSFTEYDLINSLWVGLFSFLGADSLYKAFEDKIFKSFSSMNDVTTIERR